jgi:membrane associated rhomboid family serine protease
VVAPKEGTAPAGQFAGSRLRTSIRDRAARPDSSWSARATRGYTIRYETTKAQTSLTPDPADLTALGNRSASPAIAFSSPARCSSSAPPCSSWTSSSNPGTPWRSLPRFWFYRKTCYHFCLMSLERCANCGNQFDRNFADPYSSPLCPACDRLRAQAIPASLPPPPSPGSFPVTIALIAASALVFAAMVLSGVSALEPTPQQAISFGADFGPLTFNGQWWRLVTSMFVHFGVLHIALNMWCLWNLGRAAEKLLGRFSYLLAYFVAGIFGSIASVYWHPQAAGAGASGAIFGLAGVLVSFVYLKKTPAHIQINRKMLGSLGTFVVYNLIFGAAIPGISNAAHIGGLVMGLAIGALLPNASAPESSRRARLSLVTVFSIIVLCASAYGAKQLRAGVSALASIEPLVKAGKADEARARLQQPAPRQPGLPPIQAQPGDPTYQQPLGP